MPGRALRRCCSARIDDDMGGTGGPARIEELHRRWHRLGRVGSDKKDGLGFGDVGQWERQSAVNSERSIRRRRGRGHTETSVVVDHRGPERDPGELAECVRLLVSESTTAEASDRIRAIGGPQLGDLGDHKAERLVP
jgi:hypothetical protein